MLLINLLFFYYIQICICAVHLQSLWITFSGFWTLKTNIAANKTLIV